MAMRPRGGGVNPNRPRAIVGRVHEQFKPMSEWRQEDGYDTLLVYLPGFQKEYIKVTTEDGNILRVRGERYVAGNKWSRFEEDFQVPENCDKKGIRAKFDGGILTVTMPRKTFNEPNAATSTTTRVAQKGEEQPPRRAKQEEALLRPKHGSKEKPPTLSAEGEGNKPATEEKLKRAFEATEKPIRPKATVEGAISPQKPTPTSSSKPTKQEPLKGVAEPNPEKQTDVASTSEPPSMSLARKRGERQDFLEKPNGQGEIPQKGEIGKKTQGKEREPQTNAGNTEKRTIEKIITEKVERDSDDTREKPQVGDAKVTTPRLGSDKLEEYTKVMKELARGGLTEERQLLVNMGVAILVIVALGAYVSYTIGSSSKGN